MTASEPSPIDEELRALFSPFALRQDDQIAAGDLEDLEACVRAAVRELRTEGLLPEHIIIRLRRIAVSAGAGFSEFLLERLVRWTVNEYFVAVPSSR
jgi:hypothetical protein